MYTLEDILNETEQSNGNGTGLLVLSEQHDTSAINFVAGLSDPGEMIRCGYRPELRRMRDETDAMYAERIRPLVMALPQNERDVIMGAAIARAGLDTTTGKVAAAFVGVLPWHGLGTTVSGAMTSEEAIRLAHMDWQVGKIQLSYPWGEGYKGAEAWGIVRQDTGAFLGAVGSRYQPIQNSEGFKFLDGVLAQYGAKYESAGSLHGGKTVWMLAKMPDRSFHVNGDTIEPYALFTNRHDGSGAAWCYPTAVRVECNNTLRTSAKDRSKGLSIRHTGDIADKIRSAQNALGVAVKGFEEFRVAGEHLATKPCDIHHYASDVLDAVLDVTEAQASMGADLLASTLAETQAQRDLMAKSFQKKIERRGEIMDDILSRYESERCHPRGTAWGCLNAITEHADHNTFGRQASDEMNRLSRRLESALAGDRDELKQVALQTAMAL